MERNEAAHRVGRGATSSRSTRGVLHRKFDSDKSGGGAAATLSMPLDCSPTENSAEGLPLPNRGKPAFRKEVIATLVRLSLAGGGPVKAVRGGGGSLVRELNCPAAHRHG